MAIAFYFQYVMGLEPCPLCMMQRGAVIAVGGVALVAALHNAKAWGMRIYALLLLLFASAGAALSIRHLWLQSLPEGQAPACGPSFEYMMDAYPLMQVLKIAMQGTGDCAKVVWQFLGLSIPGWMLLAFAGMALVSLVVLLRSPEQR